jgi:nucleotide-binding universal stress UspA family protein
MEKVLLAIDGVSPDRKAFKHAVELCLRIKAELKVLHIVRPQKIAGCFQNIRNTAHQARQLFEGSMMAATFAQAGEHETADTLMSEALKNINKLLPESEKAGVPYHLTMHSGNPFESIIHYVQAHKDVVIAVYDTASASYPKPGSRKAKNALQAISKALPVPVVMVQADA